MENYEEYFEKSDHILDNLTPDEELALSIFQAGISAGTYKPKYALKGFRECLEASDAICLDLVTRRNDFNAKCRADNEAAQRNPKPKVVPLKKGME
jgi:hypothetical protein